MIDYPETDGEPIAENTLQFEWIVKVKEGLDALYREVPLVFVAGDLFWYPVEGDNRTRLSPDTMVVFGRPKGHRRSYLQWLEGGIAPQVVFEILSPSNRPAEMQHKFGLYERFGVEEYYIYDPDSGLLEGYRRRAGALKKIRKMAGFVSPRLGIRFEPGEGPDNLVIVRPDGERFKTFQEVDDERKELARQRNELVRERDEASRQRDEASRQRDEVSRQRDEAAERAARYLAKLRELGIEAD